MELGKAVLAVLASGGCGAAAWALFDWMVKKWAQVATWDTLAKRATVWALCILFVAALYAASVLMQWTAQPETWRAWVEAIGNYALVAITVSQAAHAVERDRAA